MKNYWIFQVNQVCELLLFICLKMGPRWGGQFPLCHPPPFPPSSAMQHRHWGKIAEMTPISLSLFTLSLSLLYALDYFARSIIDISIILLAK